MTHFKKLLVVDDNPINQEAFHEMLDDEFTVKSAASGMEAITIAETFQPKVVLLDVMLPGMDGYETCRRLRTLPGMYDTSIIMVSARAMPSERTAGFDAGADEYVTKPCDEVELMRAIRSSNAHH